MGGFLGAISPELWGDGMPMDIAVYNDWKRMGYETLSSPAEIMRSVYCFLENYETQYGYNFDKTKQWLHSTANEEMVSEAFQYAEQMQAKYQYDEK